MNKHIVGIGLKYCSHPMILNDDARSFTPVQPPSTAWNRRCFPLTLTSANPLLVWLMQGSYLQQNTYSLSAFRRFFAKGCVRGRVFVWGWGWVRYPLICVQRSDYERRGACWKHGVPPLWLMEPRGRDTADAAVFSGHRWPTFSLLSMCRRWTAALLRQRPWPEKPLGNTDPNKCIVTVDGSVKPSSQIIKITNKNLLPFSDLVVGC